MKKSVSIYMVKGNREPVFLERCGSKETAELKIARYERADRYEVEVKKYAVPAEGFAKYIIK